MIKEKKWEKEFMELAAAYQEWAEPKDGPYPGGKDAEFWEFGFMRGMEFALNFVTTYCKVNTKELLTDSLKHKGKKFN